jgi:small-conductance mechanosensitive channel
MIEQFARLERTTLALGALVLVAVATAHIWLRWWLGRRARRHAAAVPSGDAVSAQHWFAGGLLQLLAPLALLIWIQGIYFAGRLLLNGMAATRFTEAALLLLRVGYGLSVVCASWWLLARVGLLIERFLAALSTRARTKWDDVMLPLAGRAARRTLPLFAPIICAPALAIGPGVELVLRNGATVLLIGIVSFVLFQIVDAIAALILSQHRLDVSDNLQARAIYTQVVVLRKVAVSVIAIFTLASMLMVFDSARQFGASILASAGVAGIIVGFAAQRSIATLLAGFQIALTQPIRVDDVVIVENEWGRIEDITLTYVVVRIWDLRRLIVPITYFIEKPFQNWTRSSADLLATVFLYVDYRVPLDALRAELTRVLAASPRWDRKVNVLQVTDAREQTLEIRALASAADASLAWDLRCEVRERLVDFLQREYPESLPHIRATVEGMSVQRQTESAQPVETRA